MSTFVQIYFAEKMFFNIFINPFIRAIHFVVSKVSDWHSTTVKLSCETNFFFLIQNLTLVKMDEIIKTYYKNDHSATATYRAFEGDYGLHNFPITQAIGKILKKF